MGALSRGYGINTPEVMLKKNTNMADSLILFPAVVLQRKNILSHGRTASGDLLLSQTDNCNFSIMIP